MSDSIDRRKAFEYFVTLWECIGTIMDRDEWEDVCMTTANEIPSAQPERLTDDDFETIRIHLNAYKEKLCNQHRWKEAEEYQRIIDRFMAFASAQPEPCEDAVPRASVEYICQKNTVSTNPYEHKYHDKFIQFMDDPEISDFGRWQHSNGFNMALVAVKCDLDKVPSAQPDESKYEYHYDHTDCIWYRPEARNRCPVTCAQYRDGWNDAMNYIFRDGKGYRPYRRDKQYGK